MLRPGDARQCKLWVVVMVRQLTALIPIFTNARVSRTGLHAHRVKLFVVNTYYQSKKPVDKCISLLLRLCLLNISSIFYFLDDKFFQATWIQAIVTDVILHTHMAWYTHVNASARILRIQNVYRGTCILVYMCVTYTGPLGRFFQSFKPAS